MQKEISIIIDAAVGFREAALDVIQAVGGDRKFWAETETCQSNVDAATRIIGTVFQNGMKEAEQSTLVMRPGERLRLLERADSFILNHVGNHDYECNCEGCQLIKDIREHRKN